MASGKLSSRITASVHLANAFPSATAFALPADAALASGATVNAAAEPPHCDRFRPGERDYNEYRCERIGRCEHGDWRERGRDCPRPRLVHLTCLTSIITLLTRISENASSVSETVTAVAGIRIWVVSGGIAGMKGMAMGCFNSNVHIS